MDRRTRWLVENAYEFALENECCLNLMQRSERLETQLEDVVCLLSAEQQNVINEYLVMRDELEFQTVKAALKYGKKLGKTS